MKDVGWQFTADKLIRHTQSEKYFLRLEVTSLETLEDKVEVPLLLTALKNKK